MDIKTKLQITKKFDNDFENLTFGRTASICWEAYIRFE